MKYYLKKIVRFWILFATFFALEFAVPLFAHEVHAAPLVAARDAMRTRLMSTPVPQRNMCDYISCGPVIRVVRETTMAVTAYSSTPDQTFGNPFITASGTHVHPGTFALNGIPFGTKLRIPDYFGDRIFIVEDRMHSRYSSYHGDIWMESRGEAIQWGVRRVRVEFVVEE